MPPPQPGRFTSSPLRLPLPPVQGDELETFCKFADDVDAARRELSHALSIAEVKSYLHSVNPQCLLAVKYELPNLLLEPLYHLHHYVACVEVGAGSQFCAFFLLVQRAFMLPVLLTINLLSTKRRRFWRTAAPIPPCRWTVKDFLRWAFVACGVLMLMLMYLIASAVAPTFFLKVSYSYFRPFKGSPTYANQGSPDNASAISVLPAETEF